MEAGLTYLRQLDAKEQSHWVRQTYQTLVQRIDERSTAYLRANADRALVVGSAVFDRSREIVAISDRGQSLLQSLLVS